jgi:hypothetical protein
VRGCEFREDKPTIKFAEAVNGVTSDNVFTGKSGRSNTKTSRPGTGQ